MSFLIVVPLTAYLSGVFVLWMAGRALNVSAEKWDRSHIILWPLTFAVMVAHRVVGRSPTP